MLKMEILQSENFQLKEELKKCMAELSQVRDENLQLKKKLKDPNQKV